VADQGVRQIDGQITGIEQAEAEVLLLTVEDELLAIPAETQEEMKARTNWGDILSTPRSPETANSPPPGKQ